MKDGDIVERESKYIEYKEKITKSYLKTVSAFANYEGGKIYFGVNDKGICVGVENTIDACLSIENQINDNINPNPDYSLQINDENIILLQIKEGRDKPYYYQNKAYKRNDSSTIEVERLELNRLILEGGNMTYDETISQNQNLSFDTLKQMITEQLGVEDFSTDILKTLELMDAKGIFNKAAYLFSEENEGNGIDIMRFGNDINHMKERVILTKGSILKQFLDTLDVFRRNYTYEQIVGFKREKFELIPEEAFREALANVIVHRTWDVHSHIHISMYEDKIEITSPGCLPEGLSKEEYLNHYVSVLRNPIIGNVFYRLKYIEKFGTGVKKIKAAYKDATESPKFEFTNYTIQVMLPLLKHSLELSNIEQTVYQTIKLYKLISRMELEKLLKMDKYSMIRILNDLLDKKLIEKIGKGRAVKYKIVGVE